MRLFINLSLFIASISSALLYAEDFTIASYNCGGLSDHYDYLRGAAMQKVMQERHLAEPENMALCDRIQQLALKILFAPEPESKAAQKEWSRKGYEKLSAHLTAPPTASKSPNQSWYEKMGRVITPYNIRPVIIHDTELQDMLDEHLTDLTKSSETEVSLNEARDTMAKRTFAHHLKQDIICLQEANYLHADLFPNHYEVILTDSHNGIAWNTQRFECLERLGDIMGRGVALKLLDKENQQTVLVASGHITGCNPYCKEIDPKTGGNDSDKGDRELQAIIALLDSHEADIRLIGMDSNVTSLHPRLNLLKDAGYQLDYENYLEPTCASPYQVLNTRIDWIAVKGAKNIKNVPILNVHLNNLQTNMSDHKPIAAKIESS